MNFQGSGVLVTGGAGFIGSHLVDRLLEEGARVRILDNLSTGSLRNVPPQAELLRGDIRDLNAVRKAVEGVDLVFHLAAQINPVKAAQDPLLDFEVNVRGTLNLLLAAHEAGVQRVIMASTYLYGDAGTHPVTEGASILGRSGTVLSPYAAAKAAAEAYLKVFNDELGLPTVRLRYANVYGPRQRAHSEAGVVAIFMTQALQGQPLTVFGDGRQTRDFVFVGDVVEANLAAALAEEAPGGVFNVGTGRETSILALARLVVQVTGSESPIVHGPPRAVDCRRSRVDNRRARAVLGWQPRVSLRQGLERYREWCLRHWERVLEYA